MLPDKRLFHDCLCEAIYKDGRNGPMQKRKGKLWLGGLGAISGIAFFALLLFWPERDFGQECIDRIQLGMRFEKVEVILKENGFTFVEGDKEAEAHVMYERKGEGVAILLTFDVEGITSKELKRAAPRQPVEWLWRRLARWWGGG
jgi:hypothetical protein